MKKIFLIMLLLLTTSCNRAIEYEYDREIPDTDSGEFLGTVEYYNQDGTAYIIVEEYYKGKTGFDILEKVNGLNEEDVPGGSIILADYTWDAFAEVGTTITEYKIKELGDGQTVTPESMPSE